MGKKDRDQELENIIGNLLVATIQTEKLQGRLVDMMTHYDGETPTNRTSSTYPFVYDGKLYRVEVKITPPDIKSSRRKKPDLEEEFEIVP